jgi:hypothetical protein
MRLLGRNLSRRDLIPVGAALLLPVPLVALNGYAAGLPDAVGRGLGSVVTLDAKDGRNGIEAGGRAAETGSDTHRSGRGTLKVTRNRRAGLAGLGVVPSGSAGTQTGRGANGKETEQMPSGGDTGGSGPSGDEGGSSPATGSNSSTTSRGSPSLSVTAAGQGTGTGASAGGNGLTIDLGADSAGGDEPAGATAKVTDTGGAPTSLNVGGPDSDVSLP